ncbi:MAG: phospholipase D-like domain-containing protein [Chloroflexota bacterium]|nr:phospholipase D-like domain-containing protein [Chloroflexota bacterium]
MKTHARLARWKAVLAISLLVVLAVAGCGSNQDVTDEPAGQAARTDYGFPVAQSRVSVSALPDEGMDPFLEAIDGARDNIRLKVYLITEDRVIDALRRAASRGVDTRVMIEPEPQGGGDSNRAAKNELESAGVYVKDAPSTFRMSHEKSLVLDGSRAWIMTHNLTHSSFSKNREYQVVVDDPTLVDEVSRVFDADWDRKRVDLDQSPLVWSPDNSRQRLRALIEGAEKSLDLEQTSVLDNDVVAWLIAAAERGVRVRLITPAVTDPDDWEYEDLSRLAGNGVAVRFLDDPYVHAKTMVADGAVAFVGSQNLSDSSLDQNRELGIMFDDAAAVNRLASYFGQDWNRAEPMAGSRLDVPEPKAVLPPASGVVPWREAGDYVGQTITVAGVVVDAYDAGTITFLNFDRDRTFTVVIFDENYDRFPAPPAELYFEQRVLVTGEVELHDGDPQIEVKHPDQIEIEGGSSQDRAKPKPAATKPSNGAIPWQEAGDHVGQKISVEGVVVDSYDAGTITFLNFDEDRTFTVVIFDDNYDRFPESPEDLYYKKRILVTGEVELHDGDPQIEVEHPDQIEILEDLSRDGDKPAATIPSNGLVSWKDATNYIGRRVTLEGEVVRSYNSGKVAFLNFAENYKDTLSVVIFASDFAKWPEAPEDFYLGKHIHVQGKVKEYRGAPEVIVEAPGQIEVIGTSQSADSATPATGPPISWEQAGAHDGEQVTVAGTVIDSYKSDTVILLNFSPSREAFKAVIFERNWHKWGETPDRALLGRDVLVSGKIQLYKGVPEIVVNSPYQLEILD